MSYMYLVLARGGDPASGLRLMDVPVEWRDGRFIVTGEPQDRPAPDTDLWAMLDDGPDDATFDPPSPPDGWVRLTHFWQPMRYVPSSGEVRKHARKKAVQKMLEMGITTWEQPQRLLEGNDE